MEVPTVKTFCCSYRYKDKSYALNIPADSALEAHERLDAIGQSGQVDGELQGYEEIGEPPPIRAVSIRCSLSVARHLRLLQRASAAALARLVRSLGVILTAAVTPALDCWRAFERP